jgi:hypothetical protein
LKRRGLRARWQRKNYFTLKDTAEALGVPALLVGRWCKTDVLPVHRRNDAHTKSAFVIRRADVYTFLGQRRNWVRLPQRLPDAALDVFYQDCKRRAEGQWLTAKAVAAQLNVRDGVVRSSLRRGWLTGTTFETCCDQRAWFVWVPRGATFPALLPRI